LKQAERFGKYTLLQRLAIGGTAEISLARYDGIGGFEKLVALKRLLPNLCEDRSQVAQFLNEARIGAVLAHPNVVQFYEVGEVEGRYFIAMEYVHGTDLERIARWLAQSSSRMPVEIALRVVSEVCSGLHYAHERTDAGGRPLGIVHRDISPANVLVSYDGAVKLIDFGVAKLLDRESLGRSGNFRGKFAYMSPEQCAGEPLDARSDIFSVGIVLYEVTLARRPFAGENQFQILRQITEGMAIPPRAVDPTFPIELEAIVLRALAQRREERYPTAREMQADLEQFGAWRGYRSSSVDVAEFVTQLLATASDPRDAAAAFEALGAEARARDDERAEWTIEETNTGDGSQVSDVGSEEAVARHIREGREAVARRDYRRALEHLRRALAREPTNSDARKTLDRVVIDALRASSCEDVREGLVHAAELYQGGDYKRCRVLIEDLLGDVPMSSPDRPVLRRISGILAERLALH
jgi:serine/threonine protein kinase